MNATVNFWVRVLFLSKSFTLSLWFEIKEDSWSPVFVLNLDVTGLILSCPLVAVTSQPGPGGGYGPGGTWGLVEFIVVIAGPLFLLFLLVVVGLFLYQYHQRAYSHRQRLEVEDPSCDHLYPAKDRSLQDLIYNLSTSGSGSGQCTFAK